ncbi:MAG: hypothetical protein SXA11_23750 [Cyanobacteriota bacterium]|nr:hypothetical protein [Cyanobacteriota bacterium]
MQIKNRSFSLSNSTLETLIAEWESECENVLNLMEILKNSSPLAGAAKVDILAELLAASIHLHSHCDEDFQNLIAEEMESLPE